MDSFENSISEKTFKRVFFEDIIDSKTNMSNSDYELTMAQHYYDIIMSHLDSESDSYKTDFYSESIATKSTSKTTSHHNYITTPKSKLTNSKYLNKRKSSNINSNLHPVGKRARTNEVPQADLKDFLESTIYRDDADLQRYITDKVYINKRS